MCSHPPTTDVPDPGRAMDDHAIGAPRRRVFRAATALVAALGLVAACSSPQGQVSPSPTVTSPASTSTVTSPSAPSGEGSATTQPLIKLDIGIGYFPFGPMQRSFVHYDEANQVIHDVALDYGYDLTVNWLLFPGAPDELAAFQAGDVVIGPMATFPLIAQVKAGRDFQVLSNTLGMYKFMVMVRKDGPIHDLDGLVGSTVGVAIGSAHQSAFEQFLQAEFGKSASELGITYVNQPVPIPTMPPGMDAYVTFVPAILRALEDPASDIEPLLYLTPAVTGPAYDGPLGTGADIPIPSAESSAFYPEGYTSLRNPFVVSGDFVASHPDVVLAFLVAHARTERLLASMDPHELTALWPAETWDRMPRDAYEEQSIATDLLYAYRDWIWYTSGEVDVMQLESEAMVGMSVIDSALTTEELSGMFKDTGPLMKAAYEATQEYPDASVFTDATAVDRRGIPIWAIDWSQYSPAR